MGQVGEIGARHQGVAMIDFVKLANADYGAKESYRQERTWTA